MKNLFLALILLLNLVLPAQAFTDPVLQNAYQLIMQQADQKLHAEGIPITGLHVDAGVAPSATTVTINFDLSATSDQQTAAQSVLQSFDWTVKPLPDVQRFEDTLFTDNSLTPAARLGLVGFFPQVEKYAITRPVAIQEGWQAMLFSNPPLDWLTSDVIAKTQAAANAYNVPLVAQPATTPAATATP